MWFGLFCNLWDVPVFLASSCSTFIWPTFVLHFYWYTISIVNIQALIDIWTLPVMLLKKNLINKMKWGGFVDPGVFDCILRDVCHGVAWSGHASPQPYLRQLPPLSCKITWWRPKYQIVVINKLKCKWSGQCGWESFPLTGYISYRIL